VGLRRERGKRGFKEGFRATERGGRREKCVVLERGYAKSCGSHCCGVRVERRKEGKMQVILRGVMVRVLNFDEGKQREKEREVFG